MTEFPVPNADDPEVVTPLPVEHEPEVSQTIVPPGPGFWAALGWWLLFMVAQFVIGIFAVVLLTVLHAVGLAGGLQSSSLPLIAIGTGGNLLIAVLLVCALYGSRTKRILALCSMKPLHFFLVVASTLPLAMLSSEVNNWMAEFFPMFDMMNELISDLSNKPLIVVFVVGCLFPALGEEVFFRGFLGRGLVSRYGVMWGTLITSVLFGLMHIDPVQASSAVVLGVALQLIYLATKSLWAPILLHALNNFLSFTSHRLADSLNIPGFIAGSRDEVQHTPALLILAGVFSVMTLAWMFYETRTRWSNPDGTPWSLGYMTAEHPAADLGARKISTTPRIGGIILATTAYLLLVATLAWVIQTS